MVERPSAAHTTPATTALIEAATGGSIADVSALLDRGVRLSLQSSIGRYKFAIVGGVWSVRYFRLSDDRTSWLLLAIACDNGQVDLVNYLFDTFQELNDPLALSIYGALAARAAVSQLNELLVDLLLARGLDINCNIGSRRSLLDAAATANSPQMLRFLMKRGADLFYEATRTPENPVVTQNATVLGNAISVGALDAARFLLPLATRFRSLEHAIDAAVVLKDRDFLSFLLDATLPPTNQSLLETWMLASRDDALLLDEVLTRLSVDPLFETRLDVAFSRVCGHKTRVSSDCLSVFLAHGTQINSFAHATMQSPLIAVALRDGPNGEALVKELLKHGATTHFGYPIGEGEGVHNTPLKIIDMRRQGYTTYPSYNWPSHYKPPQSNVNQDRSHFDSIFQLFVEHGAVMYTPARRSI